MINHLLFLGPQLPLWKSPPGQDAEKAEDGQAKVGWVSKQDGEMVKKVMNKLLYDDSWWLMMIDLWLVILTVSTNKHIFAETTHQITHHR